MTSRKSGPESSGSPETHKIVVRDWATMADESMRLNIDKRGSARRGGLFAALVYAVLDLAEAVRVLAGVEKPGTGA